VNAVRLYPDALGTDLDAVFGRRAPLVLEIGFGNGTFFRDLAREHPDWNLLGVEIAAASITRGIGMIRREGLEHVRVFCGDGRFVVRDLIGRGQLYRGYLNFPDPWPKERHQHRRLLRVPFFRLLSTRLDPDGGEFWFTTDHEEYFHFALEQARASGLFEIDTGTPPEAALRTKYAQRWQQQRKTIHHAIFRPRAVDPDPHEPRLEVVDVPHARLSGGLDTVGAFEKQTHHEEHGTVVLLDCARTLDGQRLLFTALAEEADLRQDLLIEARRAGSGAIYVELLAFGRPATTALTRAAVARVADWLESQGLQRVDDPGGSL
jgi:tRNA (guanine-N7-)-methyltransferase